MPAIHLFGKRTLLGGDDLHVPALATGIVRLIQLTLLIFPLVVFLWKEAQALTSSSASSGGRDWPFWKYLFDWWDAGGGSPGATGSDDGGEQRLSAAADSCTESFFARYYPLVSALHLVSSALFCFHSLSLEYQIWHWSCQGTPTMRQPRTMKVQELLEEKLGICTVLLGLIVATTYLFAAACFARPYHRCYIHTLGHDSGDSNNNNNADDYFYSMNHDDGIYDDNADNHSDGNWVGSPSWYAMGALLAISQTVEVVVAALFYGRLINFTSPIANANRDGIERSLSSSSFSQSIITVNANHQHHIVHHELIEELWADRCQSFFRCLSISTCFLFGGHDLINNAQRNNSYRHVAQALADYLETKGTLDVVPTDLFTGMLVLQRIQRQRRLQTRRRVYAESSSMQHFRVVAADTTIPSNNGGSAFGEDTPAFAAASSEANHHPLNTPVSNDEYHIIHSPDITNETGLRSRVWSMNDLRARTKHNSSRSPSPSSAILRNPASTSTFATPMKSNNNRAVTSSKLPPSAPQSAPHQPSATMSLTASPPSSSTSTSTPASSSSSSSPTEPPKRNYVHHGLPQHSKRNIYRRRHPYSPTRPSLGDSSGIALDPDPNARGGASFYRATSRQILNPFDPSDAATLEEGARMCDYALSIYTWMLYVFVHPVTGFPRLICQCGSGTLGRTAVARGRSCCCKVCSILANRQQAAPFQVTPNPVSMPLRQPRRSGPANGSYETNQQRQPLATSNPSQPLDRSRRRSDEDNDNEEEGGEYRNDIRGCDDPRTVGDNLCEWHKRALLLVAGIPEANLVYAQFNNRLSSVPYCILLDHERSLVVLSIRGSLSLEDVVTDTLVLPESLEELGERYGFNGRGQYCHSGVLACFENVLRDLQRYGWLERLLELDYPDYHLRIVGHSLGAGVCTLLGYVLRSKYPSLKVYGFSPPGCTMTWDLATNCADWSTSFVLDSDIVPRLSVLALEDLRDEVLELIGRIKVPKYKVFENFLKGRDGRKGCVHGSNERNEDPDNLYHDDDLEKLTQIIDETLYEAPPDTIYQRQLQDFLRVQAERKEVRGETNSRTLRMYPPGKMIHLLKTGEEGGCAHMVNKCLTCCTSNSGFVYTPVYISNDDLDEIVVNATMGTDHFIDRMCDELHKISNEYLKKCGATETATSQVGHGNGLV